MITKEDLIELGFNIIMFDNFWGLGEEEIRTNVGIVITKSIILYDIEYQTCHYKDSYVDIDRECRTTDEIIKFVECIKFLYHKNVVVGKK